MSNNSKKREELRRADRKHLLGVIIMVIGGIILLIGMSPFIRPLNLLGIVSGFILVIVGVAVHVSGSIDIDRLQK